MIRFLGTLRPEEVPAELGGAWSQQTLDTCVPSQGSEPQPSVTMSPALSNVWDMAVGPTGDGARGSPRPWPCLAPSSQTYLL